MKQLKCEMCGSVDLIKQDGVFVCQSCGCKYSVEEAKKMMVEGTVDVSGSVVKVDSTDQLNNLYILARRAKDSGNRSDAAKYYDEIRLIDPKSWEAAFYAVYYTAMGCTIAQIPSAANTVSNCLQSVMNLIFENVQKEKQILAYVPISDDAIEFAEMLIQAANDSFSDASNCYNGEPPQSFHNDVRERINAAISIFISTAMSIYNRFEDAITAKCVLDRGYEICKETRSDFYDRYFALGKLRKEFDEKAKSAHLQRNNEYWEEHANDRIILEGQLTELNGKQSVLLKERNTLMLHIKELEDKIEEPCKAENEMSAITQKEQALLYEKQSLNLFSGKRKKEIENELTVLSVEKNRIAALFEEQKAEKEKNCIVLRQEIKELQATLSPITSSIESLQAKISNIETELTKDR